MSTLHLLDLDGVLCDDTARLPHAMAGRWTEYFAAIPADGMWPEGWDLYWDVRATGEDFGYLTGRRVDTRIDTLVWLARYGFATDVPLIMRSWADRAARYTLAQFKVAVLLDLLHEDGSYDAVTLYDDDPAVIEAVTALGIPALTAVRCAWFAKPAWMVKRAVA